MRDSIKRTVVLVFINLFILSVFVFWLSGFEISYLKAEGLKTVTKTRWVPENAVLEATATSSHGSGRFLSGKVNLVFEQTFPSVDYISATINFTEAFNDIKQIAIPLNATFYITEVVITFHVHEGKILSASDTEATFEASYFHDHRMIFCDLFEGDTIPLLQFDMRVVCFRDDEDWTTFAWIDYEIEMEVWKEEPHQETYETLELTFTEVVKHLIGDAEIPYGVIGSTAIHYDNSVFRFWSLVSCFAMFICVAVSCVPFMDKKEKSN